MLAAAARQKPASERRFAASNPHNNISTTKFTCPRESVRPIEGRQTSTGMIRSNHHRAEPVSGFPASAPLNADSTAEASQCTPSARQPTLKKYHTATENP